MWAGMCTVAEQWIVSRYGPFYLGIKRMEDQNETEATQIGIRLVLIFSWVVDKEA